MIVHLIDGTYELFRHFYGARRANSGADTRFGGVRGVLNGVLAMFETGGTHVGVATDHIIESFRNRLWPGYKTGFGIDPVLWSQFHPLEDGLAAMGVAVWPMVELEADDALASAAWLARSNTQVEKVCIWTPDKDLAQCVVESRVVQIDGRRGVIRDQAGVQAKFGVLPASIPDYLALVGDSADGFPGLPGWGAKAAAAVLSRYRHFEEIPALSGDWDVTVRGAPVLAQTLVQQREAAFLFRDLATLRTTAKTFATVDDLRWRGPTSEFEAVCAKIDAQNLVERARALAGRN